MQTYSWSDTVTPNNNASLAAGIVFFTPSAFGAQEQCKIRAFTVRSRSNDWDPLVSTMMYAKIIDLANEDAVLAVSNGQAMTAYNHDYTFTFAECPWLARTTQYGIIFASGTADDAPMVKSGLRLAVMATAQDIYYGDASDTHGATWRPLTGFAYQIGGELELKVWNGWDFQNLGKGPRGAIGPQGTYGEVGVGGATGPKGATGLVGPQGLQGDAVTGSKGPFALTSYWEGDANETQFLYNAAQTSWVPSLGERVYVSIIGDGAGANGVLFDTPLEIKISPVDGLQNAYYVNGKIRIRSYNTYNGVVSSGPYENIVGINNVVVNYGTGGNRKIFGTETVGAVALTIYLDPQATEATGRLILSMDGGQGSMTCDPAITFTPPRYYLQRQTDDTPDVGEARAPVTSGGVAAAYCDLIDAIGTATALPAATIAQMKALYGA